MNWADSVPNLLIGLREGLEAGLVVTILLAAVRKTAAARAERGGERAVSAAPVWLGVLGAVSLAGAFAAVLTFSVSVLPGDGQQALAGLLSVLAVSLITWMIFWMRRTAVSLSAHLRGEAERAAAVGAGALTVTAFLSVGREGLETTLASIITGITELAPKMTMLQITAWAAYLAVVILAFLRAARAPVPAAVPDQGASPVPAREPGRWERLAGGHPWAVAGLLIAVPALAAGLAIAALPVSAGGPGTAVTITPAACAPDLTSAAAGPRTFTVANKTEAAGEVDLDDASGAVIGKIETIGPGASASLTATLRAGTYTFSCLMGSRPPMTSRPVTVTAAGG